MIGFPFSFLICTERSGSNLITRIFDSHADVCGSSPSHLFRTFANNRIGYGDLSKDENWHILANDCAAYINHQLGKWRTTWTAERIVMEVEERSVAAMLSCIYHREAEANNKSHLFVKENQTYNFIPFLLINFPGAKFVWQVRDPRDMALSWKLSGSHPGGVHKGANIWKMDQARSMEIYGYLNDADRITYLRYEDLITKPESELRSLCAFLEIPFDPAMLNFYSQDLTVENSKRVEGWTNLRKPLISDNYAKYRGNLSELEIRYIETLCWREMKFFGYQFDYAPDEDLETLEADLLAYEANHLQKVELTAEEQSIRQQRLDIIYQIINREL